MKILSKFELPSSSGWKILKALEEKGNSLSEFINDGGDCRTAPAIPGLLNILMVTTGYLIVICTYKVLKIEATF